MAVSVFDLFKIGIGPSSSHTVGPMRAARLFALRLQHDGMLSATQRVKAELYGSLGATGKGHGTDKAVLLGLAGHEPDRIDVDAIPALLAAMRKTQTLTLAGAQTIAFDEAADLVFHRRESLPFHANGMRFAAFDPSGAELVARTYYSVGGGFVVSDEVAADGSRQKRIAPDTTVLPLPFHSGAELLALTQRRPTVRPASCPQCCITTRDSSPGRMIEASSTSCSPQRRSGFSTRRTHRSAAPKSAARAKSASPARWPPARCAR